MKKVLLTGAAGFIGAALSQKLLSKGYIVYGIDNLNSYYDVNLKLSRLNFIEKQKLIYKGSWRFTKADIEETGIVNEIFTKFNPEIVVNLAAQAGVRYSLENPISYVKSNLLGFTNILESCRYFKVKHLVFASSSSVYGSNNNLPFSERHNVDHPMSFYGATKKSNEMMAHAYSSLFNIPMTGLRLFTVYGPLGRPDMAPMIFADKIMKNERIDIFNNGQMLRDFTFIDDITESIFRCCEKLPKVNNNFDRSNPDPSASYAPFKILNIGNGNGVKLEYFINLLEQAFAKKANKNFVGMQQGDVTETLADNDLLYEWTGYRPSTSIEEGVKIFVKWYMDYYK
tara:strand:- start:1158 stop:2180 length:1023 start_codon:yes stop_codon:yes gene_type:complete